MAPGLKTLSIKGVVWTALDGAGVATLSLGVFALMAHILKPQDFGIVALANVFVVAFNLLVAHSFADAIVQRVALEPEHLDTAFWTTLAVSLELTAICHLVARPLAGWLNEPRLAAVLPWLSWIMPLNAIGIVQTALFRRELRFRAVTLRSILGRASGAGIGVGMALAGFGVWSLVAQQIAGVAITGTAMALAAPWRPRFRISVPHLRDLWAFGVNVSASQVIAGLGEQATNLLVGKLFGTVELGYFSIAWRTVQLVRSLIASAVYHVGFSTFSRLQEDPAAVKRAFLQATRLSCLFGFPIAAGMALHAKLLVTVLYGAKWGPSIPLLSVLALQMLPAFFAMFYTACYRAMGRASWVLALSVLYAAVGNGVIVAFAPDGILAVAGAWVAIWFVLLPVPVTMLRRMLHIPVAELVAPSFAPLVASLAMAIVLMALRSALVGSVSQIALVAIGVSVAILVYASVVFVISPSLLRTAASVAHIMMSPRASSG